MDKPLAGCMRQLYVLCLAPLVKKMEAAWGCICEYTRITAFSPAELTPRAIREIIFRALWAVDRTTYDFVMARPYYSAVTTVLEPLLPPLQKLVSDRMFADVAGRAFNLRNRFGRGFVFTFSAALFFFLTFLSCFRPGLCV